MSLECHASATISFLKANNYLGKRLWRLRGILTTCPITCLKLNLLRSLGLKVPSGCCTLSWHTLQISHHLPSPPLPSPPHRSHREREQRCRPVRLPRPVCVLRQQARRGGRLRRPQGGAQQVRGLRRHRAAGRLQQGGSIMLEWELELCLWELLPVLFIEVVVVTKCKLSCTWCPTTNGWCAKMEAQSEHAHVARTFLARLGADSYARPVTIKQNFFIGAH